MVCHTPEADCPDHIFSDSKVFNGIGRIKDIRAVLDYSIITFFQPAITRSKSFMPGKKIFSIQSDSSIIINNYIRNLVLPALFSRNTFATKQTGRLAAN